MLATEVRTLSTSHHPSRRLPLVYIPLESYYDSVTFVEGTRNSSQLSLKSRPMANPLLPVS